MKKWFNLMTHESHGNSTFSQPLKPVKTTGGHLCTEADSVAPETREEAASQPRYGRLLRGKRLLVEFT